MRKTLKTLEKKESEFKSSISKMENKIQEKCDFNCGVENIPGDGFCVSNIGTDDLAPIEACIRIIKKDGRLTLVNYKLICI